MTKPIRLDLETNVLYELGTELIVDISGSAPPKATCFGVKGSPNVNYKVPTWTSIPLSENPVLPITLKDASPENDELTVIYYGSDRACIRQFILHITVVDADRDGQVEQNNPNKASRTKGIRLDRQKNVLYELGTKLIVDISGSAPPKATRFAVKGSPNVKYNVPTWTSMPLSGDTVLLPVTLKDASLENGNEGLHPLAAVVRRCHLTCD